MITLSFLLVQTLLQAAGSFSYEVRENDLFVEAALQARNVLQNEQACSILEVDVYQVFVGVDFANGSGCEDIKHALNKALGRDWLGDPWYKCSEARDGNTALTFRANPNHSKAINTALQEMYPMVNTFNCPDFETDRKRNVAGDLSGHLGGGCADGACQLSLSGLFGGSQTSKDSDTTKPTQIQSTGTETDHISAATETSGADRDGAPQSPKATVWTAPAARSTLTSYLVMTLSGSAHTSTLADLSSVPTASTTSTESAAYCIVPSRSGTAGQYSGSAVSPSGNMANGSIIHATGSGGGVYNPSWSPSAAPTYISAGARGVRAGQWSRIVLIPWLAAQRLFGQAEAKDARMCKSGEHGAQEDSTKASAQTHTVWVNTDHSTHFKPTWITASVGDTVTFDLKSSNCSLLESSFDHPCASEGEQLANGSEPEFDHLDLQVTSYVPIWMFCSRYHPSRCSHSAVFAINPGHQWGDFLARTRQHTGQRRTSDRSTETITLTSTSTSTSTTTVTVEIKSFHY